MLRTKLELAIETHYPSRPRDGILSAFSDQPALDALPADEFMTLLAACQGRDVPSRPG